jgi:hypothetical protein
MASDCRRAVGTRRGSPRRACKRSPRRVHYPPSPHRYASCSASPRGARCTRCSSRSQRALPQSGSLYMCSIRRGRRGTRHPPRTPQRRGTSGLACKCSPRRASRLESHSGGIGSGLRQRRQLWRQRQWTLGTTRRAEPSVVPSAIGPPALSQAPTTAPQPAPLGPTAHHGALLGPTALAHAVCACRGGCERSLVGAQRADAAPYRAHACRGGCERSLIAEAAPYRAHACRGRCCFQ